MGGFTEPRVHALQMRQSSSQRWNADKSSVEIDTQLNNNEFGLQILARNLIWGLELEWTELNQAGSPNLGFVPLTLCVEIFPGVGPKKCRDDQKWT